MKTLMKSCLTLLIGFWLVAAQAADFQEGKEYIRLSTPQPTTNPDKIEVVEMFWYGCPHCYHLEPYVEEWLHTKPDDVEFVRMPAVLSPRWELLARAWYTAELLGVTDKIHKPLFDAIHQEHHRINSVEDLKQFFVDHGVPPEEFDQTYNSFGVAAKINRAREMTRRYGVRGVPTLVINGKYRTSASEAGGQKQMFEVMDYLIEKERKAAESGD